MAARFHVKELAKGRPWLVIWTSSNEVHFQTGDGVRYIAQMAEQGRALGLQVILTTPLPMIDMSLMPPRGRKSEAQVNAEIAALAGQVRALGKERGFPVADVHSAVVNRDGSLNRMMFITEPDGTVMHLNSKGGTAVWEIIGPLTGR